MGEEGAPFRLHVVREAGRELSAQRVDRLQGLGVNIPGGAGVVPDLEEKV